MTSQTDVNLTVNKMQPLLATTNLLISTAVVHSAGYEQYPVLKLTVLEVHTF